MKDAYSFDADEAGAMKSYVIMRDAYRRTFDRMGLNYRLVSADGIKNLADAFVFYRNGYLSR